MDQLIGKTNTSMQKAIESFKNELTSIRSGRAHPSLVENVKADVYGQNMPISQVGTVNVVDPKTLSITVWDQANVEAVDKALRTSQLGLNPKIEGSTLFLQLPSVTEERRKELVKIVKTKEEDAKISIRNIRRDVNQEIKAAVTNKSINEDEEGSWLKKVQNITDRNIELVGKMSTQKQEDLVKI